MSHFGTGESYRRDVLETSQWEDIHGRHKTEGYEYVQQIKDARNKRNNEDWVHKHHDENDAVSSKEDKIIAGEDSDDSDFEDDDEEVIMKRMRAKRLAQLKEKKMKEKFGTLRQITRAEYVSEVAEASKKAPVVLHLYQDYVPECELMDRALRNLAAKKKATKFLRIKATNCIENFPDSSLPCLIVYVEGSMRAKVEGLQRFGGKKMTVDDLEWNLAQMDAVETELEENPRIDHIVADAMEEAVRRDMDD